MIDIDRFAPVAPVAIHERMLEKGVLGNYHLLLAHQVIRDIDRHEAFYKKTLPQTRSKRGGARGKPYIIMDNSLIELGSPLDVGVVVEAGEVVNASVIVLPDVLGDRLATLERSAHAIDDLNQLRALSPYARRVKTLGVAQGQTLNDVFSCARDLIQQVGVDVVSIPRHVTSKVGSRIELVQMVRQYGKPVHLLGFSDNLWDDFSALRIPGVMGIDSAVPIWYGLQGRELPKTPPKDADFGRRPSTYEVETSITSQVIANIHTVEQWVNTATPALTVS